MKYRLYQVDAFTEERFGGNPAGVVTNAEGLTEEQMLKIAREMNNSETAFMFPSHSEEYDVEVRFFTPTTEVPICGHATIASHYIRSVEQNLPEGRVIQKTKAGLLPVDIIRKDGRIRIVMTQGKPEIGDPFPEELSGRILSALGLTEEDHRKDCPIAFASTGHGKVMVAINSREKLDALNPDLAALRKISGETGYGGYYIFTLDPEAPVLVHGRMFAPAVGNPEDPVTGNANGPLGAYLVHFGICRELEKEDSFDFKIRQGEAIGRAGGMDVHVEKENGIPVKVQITGAAEKVFETEIEV